MSTVVAAPFKKNQSLLFPAQNSHPTICGTQEVDMKVNMSVMLSIVNCIKSLTTVKYATSQYI